MAGNAGRQTILFVEDRGGEQVLLGEPPAHPHVTCCARSDDGPRWEAMADGPVTTKGMFDSQNLAFWDPRIGQCRAYWRAFRDPATGRQIDPTQPGHPPYVSDIVYGMSQPPG